MRGAAHHNYLVNSLADAYRKAGATVFLEHPTRSGRHPRFVDLFVEWESQRIVNEIEFSSHRVENDIAKAEELHAQLLLIVVPTTLVAASVQREIRRLKAQPATVQPVINVVLLGTAVQLVANKGILMSARNVGTTTRPKLKPELPAPKKP